MENKLKNRFNKRFRMTLVQDGKSQIRENYKARDFKLSCGVTLAKFEKLRIQSEKKRKWAFNLDIHYENNFYYSK